MRIHPNYIDTKISWIGELPKHWNISKIKYTTYVKGRIGWQGLKSDEFIDEGPYLVTGTDLLEGKVNWDSAYHISEERYNEAPPIQLKEDDLLITKDGTIGKTAIVRDMPDKAILNSGVFVTRSNKYIVDFMYWILNSKIFEEYIKYFETGSTIKHLYQETFMNFSYPLPDISEQKRIVKYLKRKVCEVDEISNKKKLLIQLLEQQRQSSITEAVTKGLNPNVKMKDSGIEWIGKIPEHWNILTLRRITNLQQGLQIAQEERFYEPASNRFEYITVKSLNYKDHVTEYVEDPSDRVICKKDEILLARTGATGLVVTNVEGVFHNNFFKVNYDSSKVSKEYLVYYLKQKLIQDHFQLVAGTTTIPDLNHGAFYDTVIALPSVEEQKEIVDFLDTEVAKNNQSINQNKLFLEKLKEYRQSLIYEAVTGKIDVRELVAEKDEVSK
nr:restriction endonuclease subunit S [Exiguobacterium indicum]